MAEVVGLVASVVNISTFVVEIASSLVKLKSYVDQIKDAPEEIRTLVEHIEDFHLMLCNIKEKQRRNAYPELPVETMLASRCVDRCKRGVERLHRVVDSMATEFESPHLMKRKLKAAKIIWKRDKLEKYKAQLTDAVMLLALSRQDYQTSLLELQPDIITARITHAVQVEFARHAPTHSIPSSGDVRDEEPSSCISRTNRGTAVSKQKKSQTAWLRWRHYSMLLGWAWDVEIYKSPHFFGQSIKVYAYVPEDSLAVQYVAGGNVGGLRQLFSREEASPSTACMYGEEVMTLLDIGASRGLHGVCELLINQGADPGYSTGDWRGWNALEWFAFTALSDPWHPSLADIYDQMSRLLAANTEIQAPELCFYRGPASTFSILAQQVDPPLEEWDMEARHTLAIELTDESRFNSPDVFRMALGSGPIPPAAVTHQREGTGPTLLHAVAAAIVELTVFHFSGRRDGYSAFREHSLSGWSSIVQELVAAGADLHAECIRDVSFGTYFPWDRWDRPITPLQYLLIGDSYLWDGWGRWGTWDTSANGSPNPGLRAWLSTLRDCGVDLVEYGQRESLAWADGPVVMDPDEFLDPRDYWYGYHFGQRRVLGLTYGPRPDDWRVWENQHTDEFAGDFWSMLEREVEVMPGSWID